MIALAVLPVYLLLAFYIFIRSLKWLRAMRLRHRLVPYIYGAFLLLMAFTPLEAFLIRTEPLHRWLANVSNYWLGVLLYMLLALAVTDIIRLIVRFTPKKHILKSVKAHIAAGWAVTALVALITVYGVINAGNIKVKSYSVDVDKPGEDIHAVLIADLHMGYSVGVPLMQQMADKINAQNPDIVFLAGDIFDNDYESMDDPEALIKVFQSIKSKYGIYACWGNHDVSEKILAGFTFGGVHTGDARMTDFLERAGITLLNDESVLINDSFYVAGRNDTRKAKKEENYRKTPAELMEGLDKEKPIIVIDHEPAELSELAESGADVDLCGHTHDGQVFPGNLTINLFWENACGYLKKGNMHNIVTSGVGLFGPNMRVGTDSEICVIDINCR
ncbi:MAG: metallophosphoesterase [Clostridiales bacterium]|nr:metallophosphoesterase [Clostridiales bacterium]